MRNALRFGPSYFGNFFQAVMLQCKSMGRDLVYCDLNVNIEKIRKRHVK